jgi:hypothetical protein
MRTSAFIIGSAGIGRLAATTRAADRGEAGKIGLPGGKADPGETPVETALRESAEEGWVWGWVDPQPIHADVINGGLVLWFAGENPHMLETFKEAGRISPVWATAGQVATSGWGNGSAVGRWMAWKARRRAEAPADNTSLETQ